MVCRTKPNRLWSLVLSVVVTSVAVGCQSTPQFDESPVLHRFGDIDTPEIGEETKKDWVPIVYEEPLPGGDIRRLQNCAEYPFEPAVRGPWDSLSSKYLVEESTPKHRSTDHVVEVGQRTSLEATMKYDQGPLSEEWVRLFIGTCDGWSQRGVRRTDEQGRVVFPIEERMSAGIYGVVFQAVGDATITRTQWWVVSPETKVVAFDLRGAAFEEDGTPDTASAVSGAAELTRWHASKGHMVVYLNRAVDGQSPKAGDDQKWRKRLRADGFAVGPVVDADLGANAKEHMSHGEGDDADMEHGWGEAGASKPGGAGITTPVSTLYVHDKEAAQHMDEAGIQIGEKLYRDDYCRPVDEGQRRTGWEQLVTEEIDDGGVVGRDAEG